MKEKKIIKTLLVFISIAITSFSFFSCEKSTSELDTEKTIKIGVIGPLTGEGATYGEAMKMGIDIAIEEINENSNLNFNAVYRDSKLNPRDAISSFQYLVNNENVEVILGAAGSSISKALLPFANERKVILFSSISTADNLSIKNDYFYRNIPPNKNQAETIADFLSGTKDIDNAAILYENNDYGINMDKIFTGFFNERDGQISLSLSYESGQTDFRNQLTRIKQKNPAAIFIPGTYQEVALIVKQSRQLGLDSLLISGDGAYSEELIKIAGEAAEGFYCTLMDLPEDKESTKLNEFISTFQKKYNSKPNVYSAYSYDAMNFVSKAYEKCYDSESDNCTKEMLKNVFESLRYEGIVETIEFNEYGEINSPYIIYQVNNGEFIPLK